VRNSDASPLSIVITDEPTFTNYINSGYTAAKLWFASYVDRSDA